VPAGFAKLSRETIEDNRFTRAIIENGQ